MSASQKQGKAHWKPFTPRLDRSQIVGELINADVNGPMSVESHRGAKYYVCFKDDYSKYRRVYFIRQKNEVAKCLRAFLNEAFTAGHTVKMFRCDGGKEFACEAVRCVLSNRGIVMLPSAPYTPDQNGAVEHENCTIVELAWSMLSVSGLPKMMWAHACEAAVYVLNCTGKTLVIDKSPMELWNGCVMKNLNHLRVFGTVCYVYIPKQFRKKFDNKSVLGRLVGYLNDKDGYRVYNETNKKMHKRQ